eukprot:Tbor_TRINITY_DN2551_c0_g1::TRINITY_DN2551_c0_g1_i1::g.530::m.530/K02152/ATPeV1G, ATP6G; V-type H+-transporting ATPase subunit G
MAPKTDSVARLLAAEESRNQLIARAKAARHATVKQAKADAEEEVNEFRVEKDAELEAFKNEQMKAASNDESKYVSETDTVLSQMHDLASQRMAKVSDLVVSMVCSV